MSEYDSFDWQPEEDPEIWKSNEDPDAWKTNYNVESWVQKTSSELIEAATSDSVVKPIHVVQEMFRQAHGQMINVATRQSIFDHLPVVLEDEETRNRIQRQYELTEDFTYATSLMLEKTVCGAELKFPEWKSIVNIISGNIHYRARQTISNLTAKQLVLGSQLGKMYSRIILFQKEHADLAVRAVNESSKKLAQTLPE